MTTCTDGDMTTVTQAGFHPGKLPQVHACDTNPPSFPCSPAPCLRKHPRTYAPESPPCRAPRETEIYPRETRQNQAEN